MRGRPDRPRRVRRKRCRPQFRGGIFCVEDAGGCVKKAQGQIEHDLRRRQRDAERVEQDQAGKEPVRRAVKTAGVEHKPRDKEPVQQPEREHQPLNDAGGKPAPKKEQDHRHRIAERVNERVTIARTSSTNSRIVATPTPRSHPGYSR